MKKESKVASSDKDFKNSFDKLLNLVLLWESLPTQMLVSSSGILVNKDFISKLAMYCVKW